MKLIFQVAVVHQRNCQSDCASLTIVKKKSFLEFSSPVSACAPPVPDFPVYAVAECGVAIAKGQTLIVHGSDANIGDFPWHTGIYDKEQKTGITQVCGGSLVLPNLVVSGWQHFASVQHNQGKVLIFLLRVGSCSLFLRRLGGAADAAL